MSSGSKTRALPATQRLPLRWRWRAGSCQRCQAGGRWQEGPQGWPGPRGRAGRGGLMGPRHAAHVRKALFLVLFSLQPPVFPPLSLLFSGLRLNYFQTENYFQPQKQAISGAEPMIPLCAVSGRSEVCPRLGVWGREHWRGAGRRSESQWPPAPRPARDLHTQPRSRRDFIAWPLNPRPPGPSECDFIWK